MSSLNKLLISVYNVQDTVISTKIGGLNKTESLILKIFLKMRDHP